MTERSKKRKDLSFQEKLEILEFYDKLPKMSQRRAAVHLKISQPLLCKILKNRSAIEKSALNNVNIDRKRVRSGKDSQVEAALKIWFGRVRDKNGSINGTLIRQKAEEFAKEMGKENFTATDGWFHRWKKRENIVYKRGNRKCTDVLSNEMWINTKWPKIIAEYSPENIYNADETGIYFHALPEDTYSSQREVTKGYESSGERVTVLCCANMAGQRRGLLVIGKSKNPRCFRGIKCLPVHYYSSVNASMTTAIFNTWLLKWDKELKQKIVLLISNCIVRTTNLPLKNIRLIFLPSNRASLNQTCNQGIAFALKTCYRRELCTRILSELDVTQNASFDANEIAKQISLLDALHLLAMSWQLVSEKMIENCFRKAGFYKTNTENSVSEDLELMTNEIIHRTPDYGSKEKFENWLAVDKAEVATSETRQAVTDVDCKLEEENESSLEEEISEVPPSNSQMLEALKILRRGVQHRSAVFQKHYEYEQFINELLSMNNLSMNYYQ